MTNTTHYNMTIAEGSDVVNPLTQIFPNFNTIDGAMFANKQSGISTASEVTTGTVHAIVRANTDSNVFRFTATSAWTAGDTMTLDGNSVVVHMSDGTVPATGAYIIGAEVLAMVNSGLVTLVISSNGGVTSFNSRTGDVVPENSDYTASMVDFDNTNTTLTSTDVQGAIEEVSTVKSDITSINETGSTASQAIPSGTYFYLNGTLVRAKADIASGATFTLNTNYEVVTVGAINEVNQDLRNAKIIKTNTRDSGGITFNCRYIEYGNIVVVNMIINLYISADNKTQLTSSPLPAAIATTVLSAFNSSYEEKSIRIANGHVYPNQAWVSGTYNVSGSYIKS